MSTEQPNRNSTKRKAHIMLAIAPSGNRYWITDVDRGVATVTDKHGAYKLTTRFMREEGWHIIG